MKPDTQDSASSGDEVQVAEKQGPKKITIVFIVVLFMLPALIPLKFATDLEAGTLKLALFGLSAGLLVVNAGLLYVIYRWFQMNVYKSPHRITPSRKTSGHGSKEEGE